MRDQRCRSRLIPSNCPHRRWQYQSALVVTVALAAPFERGRPHLRSLTERHTGQAAEPQLPVDWPAGRQSNEGTSYHHPNHLPSSCKAEYSLILILHGPILLSYINYNYQFRLFSLVLMLFLERVTAKFRFDVHI